MPRPDDVEEFLAQISEHIPDVEQVNTIYKKVDDFISSSTAGLKAKNSELIKENSKLKSKTDDLNADEIRSMLDELKGKSLKDYGDNIRAETADKVSELQTSLSETQTYASELDNKYKSTLINLELRAAAEQARIRTEAIDDFVRLHSGNFQYVDGKVRAGQLTPNGYVSDVLKSAPYWLPESIGGGLMGAGENACRIDNTSAMVQSAAQAGDMNAYREARKKQKE